MSTQKHTVKNEAVTCQGSHPDKKEENWKLQITSDWEVSEVTEESSN